MRRSKPSGGRRFTKTCLIRGREDEGRKAILKTGRDQTRVASIGPDGLTEDGAIVVPSAEVLDVRSIDATAPASIAPIAALIGERGTVTIPSEIRRRHRLQAGTPVLIAEEGGAIVIRPAEITPRTPPSRTLEDLLEGITPESLHGEWQTGPAVGREEW